MISKRKYFLLLLYALAIENAVAAQCNNIFLDREDHVALSNAAFAMVSAAKKKFSLKKIALPNAASSEDIIFDKMPINLLFSGSSIAIWLVSAGNNCGMDGRKIVTMCRSKRVAC